MEDQKLNFQFLGDEITVYLEENKNIIFEVRQVAKVLGYSSTGDVNRILDEEEKLTWEMSISGQKRKVSMMTESGLYSSILRSRKPEAKEFKKWVTSEVLPSIRKHGMYADEDVLEKGLTDPEYVIRVFTKLKEEKEARAKAEKEKEIAEESARLAYNKIVEDKPKVEFAESLLTSSDCVDIGTFAAIVNQNGFNIGRNKLFGYLRDNGYLIKSGVRRNQPTIKYVTADIFEVKTSVHNDRVCYQTLITPYGQEYLMKKIKSGK